MNASNMTSGLLYRGEVESKRQTYYIYEGKRHFLVMSFSRAKRNAGNFNIINSSAVQYVLKRFAGKKAITATALYKASRKPQYVASQLDALNILYVLAATKQAKIDTRFKSKSLFFNIR
ncbi:MAG: hypothetical protein U1F87_04940 [Kiritimatiellia bacterium]